MCANWFNRRANKDDFVALKAANVTVEGKIALAKYGGPFRGLKVQNAQESGMVGVVMFSDPGDDGPQVAKGQDAYPRTVSFLTFSSNTLLTRSSKVDQHGTLRPSRGAQSHSSISTQAILQHQAMHRNQA